MHHKKIKNLESVRESLRSEARLEDIARNMYAIELRASGNDSVKACCPFHKEDTPSFGISKEKQLYNCFGCHAGGDVFKFVQEMDSVEHIEAIVKIAEFVGFDLKPHYEAYTEDERRQQELYNFNGDVADYASLEGSARVNEFARARKIPESVLREFRVGYTKSLSSTDIPAAEAADAKILELDRVGKWENRLTIPLRDHFGRIGGFRNKDIDGSSKVKIIGPETGYPLYVPEFYGLFEARKHIRQAGYLILVEGEADVWQMVAHGYRNVASMMGTKLTQSMLATLESLAINRVTVIPDNDDAGRKFARSLARDSAYSRILLKIGTLSGNGKDPDEVLLSDGVDAVGACLAAASYSFEYLIDRIVAENDVTRHTGRLDVLHDLKEFVGHTSNIVRELVCRKLSDTLRCDYESVVDFYRESTEGQEQAPLNNIAAERIVLKRMLSDEVFLGDGLLALKKNDFYLSKHSAIFEAIGVLYRKQQTVNEDTVRTFVENKSGEGSLAVFTSILADSVDVSGAGFMLEDLRDKSIRRSMQAKARDAANRLGVSKLDAKETVQQLASDLSSAIVGGGDQITEVSQIVHERIGLMHERIKSPNAIIGLDMGPEFSVLNSTLHGLQRKRYIVVSAPSGIGKTAFAGVLARRVAVDLKQPTLTFTFETGKEALTDRLISNISGVESDKIVTGYISAEEAKLVHEAAAMIAAAPLVITERGESFEECVAIMRHDVLKRGTRFVTVDYIQLMRLAQADSRLRRDQELGLISRGFLSLAKELDITLLVIAQQNREAVKAGSNEGTGVGESFKIFQDSDVFITFREKTKEEIDADGPEKGNRKLKLPKHRHGKSTLELNMMADLDVMRMCEFHPGRKMTR